MKIIYFVILFCSCSFCSGQDLHLEIYQKINKIRKQNHLSSLVSNDKIQKAAQSQSDWMAQVGRMAHLREKPSSFELFKKCDHHPANRLINAGYFNFDELFSVNFQDGIVVVHPKIAANENLNEIIAYGNAPGRQAYNTDIIIHGWMNSPGHRDVILTPNFKEFGIGISSLKLGEVYWCVVFANR